MTNKLNQEEQAPQEYVRAEPQDLPKPTYMPFTFAFSLLMVGWGLLSTWIIFVAGLVGMGISIFGWIKELLDEPGNEN